MRLSSDQALINLYVHGIGRAHKDAAVTCRRVVAAEHSVSQLHTLLIAALSCAHERGLASMQPDTAAQSRGDDSELVDRSTGTERMRGRSTGTEQMRDDGSAHICDSERLTEELGRRRGRALEVAAPLVRQLSTLASVHLAAWELCARPLPDSGAAEGSHGSAEGASGPFALRHTGIGSAALAAAAQAHAAAIAALSSALSALRSCVRREADAGRAPGASGGTPQRASGRKNEIVPASQARRRVRSTAGNDVPSGADAHSHIGEAHAALAAAMASTALTAEQLAAALENSFAAGLGGAGAPGAEGSAVRAVCERVARSWAGVARAVGAVASAVTATAGPRDLLRSACVPDGGQVAGRSAGDAADAAEEGVLRCVAARGSPRPSLAVGAVSLISEACTMNARAVVRRALGELVLSLGEYSSSVDALGDAQRLLAAALAPSSSPAAHTATGQPLSLQDMISALPSRSTRERLARSATDLTAVALRLHRHLSATWEVPPRVAGAEGGGLLLPINDDATSSGRTDAHSRMLAAIEHNSAVLSAALSSVLDPPIEAAAQDTLRVKNTIIPKISAAQKPGTGRSEGLEGARELWEAAGLSPDAPVSSGSPGSPPGGDPLAPGRGLVGTGMLFFGDDGESLDWLHALDDDLGNVLGGAGGGASGHSQPVLGEPRYDAARSGDAAEGGGDAIDLLSGLEALELHDEPPLDSALLGALAEDTMTLGTNTPPSVGVSANGAQCLDTLAGETLLPGDAEPQEPLAGMGLPKRLNPTTRDVSVSTEDSDARDVGAVLGTAGGLRDGKGMRGLYSVSFVRRGGRPAAGSEGSLVDKGREAALRRFYVGRLQQLQARLAAAEERAGGTTHA